MLGDNAKLALHNTPYWDFSEAVHVCKLKNY
jgi:hypothetical protein